VFEVDEKNQKGDKMSVVDLVWMRRPKINAKRFIEIDLFRGLAILLMIFGHLLWDLDYFGVVPMNNIIYSSLQKTVPPMFFLIVGIGLIVSIKRKELKKADENTYYKRLIVRGLKIFNLGMFLTIFSLIFIPERPVFFGVLHCIGLSVVLGAVFLKYRRYNFLFAVLIISLGVLFMQYSFENASALHLLLGMHPANIWSYTVDYFPLFPWFGIALLGMVIGDALYNGDKRRFRMPDLSKYRPAKMISWIGQHSLVIYLLHQPIITGIMYFFVRTL